MTENSEMTREHLQTELQEAERELAYWQRQLQQKPDFGLGRGSTGADQWEMAMMRSEQVSERIEALQDALLRFQEDDYGRCENCGGRIDPERLQILPETTLCVDCARAASDSPGPARAPAV